MSKSSSSAVPSVTEADTGYRAHIFRNIEIPLRLEAAGGQEVSAHNVAITEPSYPYPLSTRVKDILFHALSRKILGKMSNLILQKHGKKSFPSCNRSKKGKKMLPPLTRFPIIISFGQSERREESSVLQFPSPSVRLGEFPRSPKLFFSVLESNIWWNASFHLPFSLFLDPRQSHLHIIALSSSSSTPPNTDSWSLSDDQRIRIQQNPTLGQHQILEFHTHTHTHTTME